jgi:hypothetical protein
MATRPADGEGQRLQLLRDRAWIASDGAVDAALVGHPILPVRDIALRRSARLLAFVLGLIASPSDETLSIATLAIPVDVDALGARLAMPQRELEDALRALLTAGVLTLSSSGQGVRFSPDVVPPSGLAMHVRWPLVLERLTMPPREGTQAALLLFRIFLDRLHHPAEQVALPRGDAARSLGLSGDQVRRGVRALIETGLWDSQRTPGRRGQYALGRDVLVGAPALRTDQPSSAELLSSGQGSAMADRQPEEQALTPSDVVIRFGDRRIVVPPSVKEVTLPDRAVRAAMDVDPTSGEMTIVLS